MKLNRFKGVLIVIAALVLAAQAFAAVTPPSLFISDTVGCMAAPGGLGVIGCGASASYVLINGNGVIGPSQGTFTAGGASNPTTGSLAYVGVIGSVWTVNIVAGISKPAVTFPELMDLSDNSTSNAAGNLVIEFTDIGFGPVQGFQVAAGGTLNTNGGTSTYTDAAFYDTGNSAYCTTLLPCAGGGPNQIGSTLTFNSPPAAFSGSTGSGASVAFPFSVTDVMTLHHAGAGNSSNDQKLMAGVPEPASVALLGGVLLLTFKALRRKQRA